MRAPARRRIDIRAARDQNFAWRIGAGPKGERLLLNITVVNRTPHLHETELRRVIHAINRQMAEHFEPAWKFGAELHLHADGGAQAHGGHVSLAELPGLHGDAVIYIADKPTIDGAEGYHARNNADKPFGFVFLDVCREQKDNWTVALSHEAIELVGDPMSNLLVQGPSPHDKHALVFHMFELCDPVTNDTYLIDGVEVSNFVLPGFFVHGATKGGGAVDEYAHNDFKNRMENGKVLKPFDTTPGGNLTYYDGGHGDRWKVYTAPGDVVAEQRIAAKKANTLARLERRRKLAGG